MMHPLYKTLNDSDIQNNDFSNLNPNNPIIGKNITLQFTTPDNTLQFYVPKSNAIDNLQPSVITSNSNATLRFEQDDRPPILGDDSEGPKE